MEARVAVCLSVCVSIHMELEGVGKEHSGRPQGPFPSLLPG